MQVHGNSRKCYQVGFSSVLPVGLAASNFPVSTVDHTSAGPSSLGSGTFRSVTTFDSEWRSQISDFGRNAHDALSLRAVHPITRAVSAPRHSFDAG